VDIGRNELCYCCWVFMVEEVYECLKLKVQSSKLKAEGFKLLVLDAKCRLLGL
jgi:hypothetical protein